MSPMPTAPPLKEDPVRIEVCGTAEELAGHAASMFVAQAARALGSRGLFTVALSGGRTPRRMYELLGQDHLAHQVVWPAVHVFFSDERCVPPDDDRSNYGMARRALLSKLPLPPSNVHRMRGEDPDPSAEAARYEREIRDITGDPPRLDMVLLGMGEDGHTASLFPADAALGETRRLAAAVRIPDGTSRLTITLPAINAARLVAVIVSGERKAPMLQRVLGSGGAERIHTGLPIGAVRPSGGQLLWLLDSAAASMLQPPDAPHGAAGA